MRAKPRLLSCSKIYLKDRFQIVPFSLDVSNIVFVGVENGIMNHNLPEFLTDILLVNLDALRGLVRGSLTFLQREILSALIVIEVHSRDVTQNLVDLETVNVNDFDWISQLR